MREARLQALRIEEIRLREQLELVTGPRRQEIEVRLSTRRTILVSPTDNLFFRSNLPCTRSTILLPFEPVMMLKKVPSLVRLLHFHFPILLTVSTLGYWTSWD